MSYASILILSLTLLPYVRRAVQLPCVQSAAGLCTPGKDELDGMHVPQDVSEPPLPPYRERQGESVDVRRARLLYQSRKRGMLENDLLLSSFASKYLTTLTESQLHMYDTIINKPSNDWEIYYWITGQKEVPEEFDNEVLQMMVEHSKNKDMEDRTRMPDIYQ